MAKYEFSYRGIKIYQRPKNLSTRFIKRFIEEIGSSDMTRIESTLHFISKYFENKQNLTHE
jgi:hypothetical protein